MGVRKNLLIERVVWHWDRLPGKVMEPPAMHGGIQEACGQSNSGHLSGHGGVGLMVVLDLGGLFRLK